MGICLEHAVGFLLSLVWLARLSGGSTAGWGSGEDGRLEPEDLEGTGLCSQESLGGREEMTIKMQSCRGQQLEGTVSKLQLSFHYQ